VVYREVQWPGNAICCHGTLMSSHFDVGVGSCWVTNIPKNNVYEAIYLCILSPGKFYWGYLTYRTFQQSWLLEKCAWYAQYMWYAQAFSLTIHSQSQCIYVYDIVLCSRSVDMIKQLYVICFWLLLCVHKLWFSDSLNYVKHVLETLSQPRLHNVLHLPSCIL